MKLSLLQDLSRSMVAGISALVILSLALPCLASRENQRRTVADQPPTKRDISKVDVGDPAPDFSLKDLDGKEVKLSSFKGQKPVFLVFGSYT